MILDSLENAERYYGVNKYFKKAFEFLKSTKLDAIEGRVNIDGDKVYAIAVKTEGAGHTGAEMELHKKYIDIQVCLAGIQEFGWRPASECVTVTKPFDDNDDYGFFGDEPDLWIKAKPGQFAIFFPWDGHTPKGGSGHLHKVVVKVSVD